MRMAKFEKGDIIEHTENYRLDFSIKKVLTSEMVGTTDWLISKKAVYPVRLYDIDRPALEVHFPYLLDVRRKGIGSIIDRLAGKKEIDIDEEIDSFFKVRAGQASTIIDHETFVSSPGWYMFYPLLLSEDMRSHYGVTLSCRKDHQSHLLRGYFKGPYKNLMEYYAYNPGSKFALSIDDGNSTSKSKIILNPKDPNKHDAIDFIGEWGIEILHE